jgi:hypothetical protein
MRYFFNLAGATFDPDNLGEELAGISAARVYAVRHAAEIIRDHPMLVWSGSEVRVEVTNADRLQLFTVIVLGIDSPIMGTRT